MVSRGKGQVVKVHVVQIATRIPEPTHQMMEMVANNENRSIAYVAAQMIELGLATFTKGKMRLPVAASLQGN